MIELTEIEKEFLNEFVSYSQPAEIKPEDWFYPTNNNSNNYDIAERLVNKGKLMRITYPVINNGSFMGLRHYYKIYNDETDNPNKK